MEGNKIKVNRTFIEKEKINKIKNYPFKKSILYNLKLNPGIIINEFHQTSNNINTNINIKKDKYKNSESISRNNNFIDDNNDSNFYPYNKYYHSFYNDNYKREEETNEYTLNKTYMTSKRMKNNFNSIERENYNLNDNFVPLTSRIHFHNSNRSFRERIPYIKNIIKINEMDKQKIKLSDYIIPNIKEEIKISKYERPKTERTRKLNKFNINKNDYIKIENNNIYSNKMKNWKIRKKHLSQEEIIIPNKEKIYNKKSNVSMNFINYCNTTISEGINSFRDNQIEKKNDDYLNTNNNYINEDLLEFFDKYKANTYVDWKNNKALNMKLMNYRIKLFKEFFIHFEKYYKAFIRKYQIIFFQEIKYYCYRNGYNNLNVLHNKNSTDNNKIYIDFGSVKNNLRESILREIYKNSTSNNDNTIMDKNIYTDIKSSLFNNLETKADNISVSSLPDFSKNILTSVSRKEKDINCFSDRLENINKSSLDSSIKSPFSRIGNQTSRNNELNFVSENYEKENKLYRSIEELNKKGEQIKRRKNAKKEKEKEKNIVNLINIKKVNKEDKVKKIKETKEYGQFSELRKNIIKKNHNNINKMKSNNTITRSFKLNLGKNNNKTLYNLEKKKSNEIINKNIKYNFKNKNSNLNAINYKANNKSNMNMNINNNNTFYKKIKIDINKKSIISDKFVKNIKNNKSNIKINNINKKIINSNKKMTESDEKGPKLINKLYTKDNRIHINIFYYNYSPDTKNIFTKYKLLLQSKNFSMNLINNNFSSKTRNKEIKRKQLLSSIKEEEVSNQNSKILDENVTPFNLNNSDQYKEVAISQFINMIETILIHIYKRILLYKMKTINIVNKMSAIFLTFDEKKKVSHRKNKSIEIYNKKLGIKVRKKINKQENKNGIEKTKIKIEHWNRRVNELKKFLIFYATNKNK